MSKIKVIVEIEKRTYELLKEKPDNIAEEIIANGTPYPQGEWQGGELGHCTNCGHKGSASDIWSGCTGMFCPNCGAPLTDV